MEIDLCDIRVPFTAVPIIFGLRFLDSLTLHGGGGLSP